MAIPVAGSASPRCGIWTRSISTRGLPPTLRPVTEQLPDQNCRRTGAHSSALAVLVTGAGDGHMLRRPGGQTVGAVWADPRVPEWLDDIPKRGNGPGGLVSRSTPNGRKRLPGDPSSTSWPAKVTARHRPSDSPRHPATSCLLVHVKTLTSRARLDLVRHRQIGAIERRALTYARGEPVPLPHSFWCRAPTDRLGSRALSPIHTGLPGRYRGNVSRDRRHA
jgi:hypothetical protein